jgi:hypothetical protein
MAATDATLFGGDAHHGRCIWQHPAISFSSATTNDRTPETQMHFLTTAAAALIRLGAPTALFANLLACAPVTQQGIPPAPIALRWPDPAFLPERQCHRAVPAEHLASYLPRASLTMTIPGTRSVTVDRERGCLTIVPCCWCSPHPSEGNSPSEL